MKIEEENRYLRCCLADIRKEAEILAQWCGKGGWHDQLKKILVLSDLKPLNDAKEEEGAK